eukprot:TRINITY_DN17757_c0_g1_i12.p4 TRINITY_DN17757_c0_g1~~TRINITY_DN17757_c0_g1_i12.p4  ORF type:complete len:110 (-),score=11.75 TRINITY_DN17757_c0_g1_i12:361-690(-)
MLFKLANDMEWEVEGDDHLFTQVANFLADCCSQEFYFYLEQLYRELQDETSGADMQCYSCCRENLFQIKNMCKMGRLKKIRTLNDYIEYQSAVDQELGVFCVLNFCLQK